MVWVILLIVLAVLLGVIGLVIEALQFLLGVGVLVLLIAVAVGFWLRGKVRRALDEGHRPEGSG